MSAEFRILKFGVIPFVEFPSLHYVAHGTSVESSQVTEWLAVAASSDPRNVKPDLEKHGTSSEEKFQSSWF